MTAAAPTPTSPLVTPEQRAAFARDGFLVLPGFVRAADCEALMARARELVGALDVSTLRSVFSTVSQTRTADEYFLDSGDKIRFFLEADALLPDGSLRPDVSKERALNKIGHALHDLDPVFARFSRQPALAQLCDELGPGAGLTEPRVLQSMYIFKQPRIGGEVVYHQDSTFLYTDPPSALGLWFALQDATEENGCLYAVPGGHRRGLSRRFRRSRPDEQARTGSAVTFDEIDPQVLAISPAEEIPLVAAQGTLVVLHGLLPHRSGANRSERARDAYTLHVISAHSRYPADNWLQRDPAFPARGF